MNGLTHVYVYGMGMPLGKDDNSHLHNQYTMEFSKVKKKSEAGNSSEDSGVPTLSLYSIENKGPQKVM